MSFQESLSSLSQAFNQFNFELDSKDQINLQTIYSSSHYAFEQIQKQPQIYSDWKLSGSSLSYENSLVKLVDYSASIDDLKKSLRNLRHYHLVQIVLNDICAETAVEKILEQISSLADALIKTSLEAASLHLEKKHGIPLNANSERQQLLVIAMGKLGGGELNFSSDIDLILSYAEDGELKGIGNLSYREFYIRVGRLMTQLLNDVTGDGFVYRVDLRLRPWGNSGPLVVSLDGLAHYYHLHGREWERYALVKSRLVNGLPQEIQAFKQIVSPFVFRKYFDFNVFSELGSLKQQIDKQAKLKQQLLNIKLFSGGIREIEFCMQALQILRGGRNPQLQTPSIMDMFEHAKNEKFYSSKELHVLTESYLFYRLIENRIQMLNDQQTHDLPESEEAQISILSALNFDTWLSLLTKIEKTQLKVHAIFKQLFLENEPKSNEIDFTHFELEDWIKYCHETEIQEAEELGTRIHQLLLERSIQAMSSKGKSRLFQLLPELFKLLSKSSNALIIFEGFYRLFISIAGRSVYLELINMHQTMLYKLIDLFSLSEWLSQEIIKYPVLLESVLITNDLEESKSILLTNLRTQISNIKDDKELTLDILRVFKRQQVFQIALKESQGLIDALKASRLLSELAELLLQVSYELSFSELEVQYGQPCYQLDGALHYSKFAVIAYGKLGGKELHYESDLDVIFLHDSMGTKQQTTGEKCISNEQFYMRLAQKITSSMSLMTSSGRLYEIDSRLRPNGASGYLVSSIESYQNYQLTKAWVWEHQALVRATLCAGEESFRGDFEKVKCNILAQQREPESLQKEICEMRNKMYEAKFNNKKHESFNLKHSRGGLVDIEFMVQYFVLLNANKQSSLCQYSDNIRLLEELVSKKVVAQSYLPLLEIYQQLHYLLHQQVLSPHTNTTDLELIENNVEQVKNLWQQSFKI